MVKALVTIEGVGNIFDPDIDIPSAARKHVRYILMQEFNPLNMIRDSALVLPEMVDVLRKSPLTSDRGDESFGVKSKETSLGTFEWRAQHAAGWLLPACRSFHFGNNGPWFVWVGLFVLAVLLAIRS